MGLKRIAAAVALAWAVSTGIVAFFTAEFVSRGYVEERRAESQVKAELALCMAATQRAMEVMDSVTVWIQPPRIR